MPSSSTRLSTSLAMLSGRPAAVHRSQTERIAFPSSTRRVSRTSGLPKCPSSDSRAISPAGQAVSSAWATCASSSVAWQYVRASIQRTGSLAMQPLQRLARPAAEVLEGAFVHEHDVRDRDHLAEPPAQLPHVPGLERLVPRRIILSAALHHALVAGGWRGVDREDRQMAPERFPEDVEFGAAAEAVDQHPLALDPWQSPLRPHAVPMRLALRMREPSDGGVRNREAAATRLLPHDVAHADDRETEFLCHGQDLLLTASGHARDAHDVHGSRGN